MSDVSVGYGAASGVAATPAVAEKKEEKVTEKKEEKYQGNLKKVTLNGLGDTYLDKDIAADVVSFEKEAKDKGITLVFNSAYRTPEKQESLKDDASAITPADKSLHSAGLAVDVNYSSLKDIPGGLTGDQQRTKIREAATKAGLNWGGNFKDTDPPHFYKDPGTSRDTLIKNATDSYTNLKGK